MYNIFPRLAACFLNAISCRDMKYAFLPLAPLVDLRVGLAGVVWLIWWQTEYQSASGEVSEALSGG